MNYNICPNCGFDQAQVIDNLDASPDSPITISHCTECGTRAEELMVIEVSDDEPFHIPVVPGAETPRCGVDTMHADVLAYIAFDYPYPGTTEAGDFCETCLAKWWEVKRLRALAGV